MLCEMCNTREARIIYTEIINGQRKEQHLCENCAEQQTRAITGKLGNEISFGSILSGILQNYAKGIAAKNANEPVCMRCGLTASELIKSGRVGCPACYNAFSMILDKNLKTSQGAVEHKGKVPVNAVKTDIKPAAQNVKTAADIMNEAADEIARKNDRRNLIKVSDESENDNTEGSMPVSGSISELIEGSRNQLRKAVEEEDFAEAARLRDLIRKLEKESLGAPKAKSEAKSENQKKIIQPKEKKQVSTKKVSKDSRALEKIADIDGKKKMTVKKVPAAKKEIAAKEAPDSKKASSAKKTKGLRKEDKPNE